MPPSQVRREGWLFMMMPYVGLIVKLLGTTGDSGVSHDYFWSVMYDVPFSFSLIYDVPFSFSTLPDNRKNIELRPLFRSF
jgi:hypothetical protein